MFKSIISRSLNILLNKYWEKKKKNGMEWKMPGLSDERICKQTELIVICYINTPLLHHDLIKEIKTVRKKKKKKTPQVPIVAFSGPIKERCTAEAINKVKFLSQACIHTVIIPGNMLLKDISSVLLITTFAVPRLLVVKIHGFLIIDPTTLFLDIAHLLVC